MVKFKNSAVLFEQSLHFKVSVLMACSEVKKQCSIIAW